MGNFVFYLAIFMQLVGMAFVGLCLIAGLSSGDYHRQELIQFVVGMLLFYSGHFLKRFQKQ